MQSNDGCSGGSTAGASVPSVRFLSANDVYRPERFAAVASMVEELGSCQPTHFVLPGDLLGGSLFATASRGEAVIDVLNAMPKLDYCTLGNHEFDYGAERTVELMSKSRFRWLGSNVREMASGKAALFHNVVDTDIFGVSTTCGMLVKVGVFGLCTQATPQLSHPGPTVRFESPVEHARRCTQELRQQGCELVVALTHLTLQGDKDVAEACPGVDAILGGHDHDPYLLMCRGTLIAKCGQNADHLGVLDFFLDRGGHGGGLRIHHSFQLLSTHAAKLHPAVVAAAEKWRDEGSHEAVCVVGERGLSTKSQELRSSENAFGSLVADAIVESYRTQGCIGAIQNGGFIRQDRWYPPGTVMTEEMIRAEMPFPKRPDLLSASGAELKRGLEEMLAPTPAPVGCFPQLSEGFRLTYCPSAPAMAKIQRLELHGREVQLDERYLVAISEFYSAAPGDGVEAFSKMEHVASHGRLIREVALEHMRSLGTVDGGLEGRIEVVPPCD